MIDNDPPETLCERLGWEFSDPELCERALAHRSWCAEHPDWVSNERLEFLGDAVLGMVVTDQLFQRHPDRSEGWLSRARSDLVRAGTLYAVALELSLGDHIRLGKGEELTGGRSKPSILADSVEALLGAVYLDGGIDAATSVVKHLFDSRLDDLAEQAGLVDDAAPTDAKSRLQELCARDGGEIPTYVWSESGPEHEKRFTADVLLAGRRLASGTGHSKKQAEQDAASAALGSLEAGTWNVLDLRDPESPTGPPTAPPDGPVQAPEHPVPAVAEASRSEASRSEASRSEASHSEASHEVKSG